MSLPINRKVLDPSLLASLTRAYESPPNTFLEFLKGDQQTVSPTMLIQKRCPECGINYTDPQTHYCRHWQEMEADRRRAQKEMMMREMYSQQVVWPPVPDEMSRSVSEFLKRDMDTRVNEATFASLVGSIPMEPLPSFTDPSNSSGASLLTSFLSGTSAKSLRSNPSSSRSGPPKLLSSPSKAIATKSYSPNSKKSSENK